MDRNYIIENRNSIGRCPCCNSNIRDRVITLHSEMVSDLYKVYCWCSERGRTEFRMSDVKALMSKSSYANFSKFLRMGNGAVFRPKRDGKTDRSAYGIDMGCVREFFAGRRTMTVQATVNQITDTVVERKDAYVQDFPSVMVYLKANGLYDYERKEAVAPPRKKVWTAVPNGNGSVTMKLI
jgi:hypothetical protein